MNKQQMLDYYSSHYLSKQDIMFKLPFNISADAFWKELLNRRKMNATVLPLYNCQGKPYWYVMTEKMIKASEVLCEEAMKQEFFDPYRMEMTTAMTWEMFFTSYLEGAQIDMDDAIDYLSKDAEPTDIQEQLLWNNRQALTAMVGGICLPIDDGFTGQLAYLLTQDMDNEAVNYRQTDSHLIAAMSDNTYSVPPAFDIPNKMNDLFSFLKQLDVHPLIKAAVSQAYILTTRPYPEGNERLSRIISTIILYRSGYEYFRDISISRVIAKESYRYYQSMREILNPDSDGDITCFVEYLIDLLARALIASKEDSKKRKSNESSEVISTEQKMAIIPIGKATSPPDETPEDAKTDDVAADILSGANLINISDTTPPKRDTSSADKDLFCQMLKHLSDSKSDDDRLLARCIKVALKEGYRKFDVQQWAYFTHCDLTKAQYDCDIMEQNGLVIKIPDGKNMVYCFSFLTEAIEHKKSKKAVLPKDTKPSTNQSTDIADIPAHILKRLDSLSRSTSECEKRIGTTAKKLIEQGKLTFTTHDWASTAKVRTCTADVDLNKMIKDQLIYRQNYKNYYVYMFGIPSDGDMGLNITDKQRKLIKVIQEHFNGTFYLADLAEYINANKHSLEYHIKKMICYGIVEQNPEKMPFQYSLTEQWREEPIVLKKQDDQFESTGAFEIITPKASQSNVVAMPSLAVSV